MEKLMKLIVLALMISLGGCEIFPEDDMKPSIQPEMNVQKSEESPSRNNR